MVTDPRSARLGLRLAAVTGLSVLVLAPTFPHAAAATSAHRTAKPAACPATRQHSRTTVAVRNGSASHGLHGWGARTQRGHISLRRSQAHGSFGRHPAVTISRHAHRTGWSEAHAQLRRSRGFAIKRGAYRATAWVKNLHGTRSHVALAVGRGFRHYAGLAKPHAHVIKGRSWHRISMRFVAKRSAAHAAVYILLPHRKSVRTAVTRVAVRKQSRCSTQNPISTQGSGDPAIDPSGVGMPVGDQPGWHQVLAENFATPAQSFPGPYAGTWTGYNNTRDTDGNGMWENSAVSVHDGVLDMHLRTVGGEPNVAAPIPMVNGQWGGITYGAYTVRFHADNLPGYKTEFLLWPDSNVWNDGEIDFPEGGLDSRIYGYDHHINDPMKFDAFPTKAGYQSWHTATIEWLPSGVTFFLDGNEVGHSSVSPSGPMHWVLQTCTNGRPASSVGGHVAVDWAAIYTRS